MCFGRLEAVLARHWPEFGQWMDVRNQKSALRLLATYASPARAAAEPDATRSFLRSTSHGRLSAELIAGVVAGAATSMGVPMMREQ